MPVPSARAPRDRGPGGKDARCRQAPPARYGGGPPSCAKAGNSLSCPCPLFLNQVLAELPGSASETSLFPELFPTLSPWETEAESPTTKSQSRMTLKNKQPHLLPHWTDVETEARRARVSVQSPCNHPTFLGTFLPRSPPYRHAKGGPGGLSSLSLPCKVPSPVHGRRRSGWVGAVCAEKKPAEPRVGARPEPAHTRLPPEPERLAKAPSLTDHREAGQVPPTPLSSRPQAKPKAPEGPDLTQIRRACD